MTRHIWAWEGGAEIERKYREGSVTEWQRCRIKQMDVDDDGERLRRQLGENYYRKKINEIKSSKIAHFLCMFFLFCAIFDY